MRWLCEQTATLVLAFRPIVEIDGRDLSGLSGLFFLRSLRLMDECILQRPARVGRRDNGDGLTVQDGGVSSSSYKSKS